MRSRDDAVKPGHANLENAATVANGASPDTEDLRGLRPTARTDGRVQRGDHIDRFTVVEELGAGGMGQVVAAYDPKLDRKVAIKTLRTELFGSASPAATMRLMREARAMAKLSHPNVVTVYEVGTIGQQIYVAMELVDGGTLRDWLGEGARGWAEIVSAFVQAGHGLEAAHAAGLVHRDFKPDNVLVDPSGRVKVTDFGLVGTSSEVQEPGQPVPRQDSPMMVSLTQTGTVMGTPLYMAPEQHNGEPTDARADQFAFCVALYEALYDRHPFAAESRAELVRKVVGGELEPISKRTQVPAWVHDIAVRGLSAQPNDRFSSMTELVSALERDPRVRRRKIVMAVGVLAIAAAAIIWWQRQGGASSVCRGSEQRLAGVWDTASKHEIRAAFVATNLPFAEDSFDRAAGRIDVYTREWTERRTDSCEAAQDRRELSPTQLDLRMHCFDMRLLSLGAALDRWRSATPADVEAAVDTAFALPGLARCTDTKALASAFPLPANEVERRQIDELTKRLASASAAYAAGDLRAAEVAARKVVEAVEPLHYPPLLGAALLIEAKCAAQLSKVDLAEELSRRAIDQASKAKDDRLAAEGWASLIYTVGFEQSRHAEALAMQPALEAAISRGRISDVDAADHIANLAQVYGSSGDLRGALEQYERALRAVESAGEASTPFAVRLRGAIAALYSQFGRFDESERLLRQVVTQLTEILGPSHSNVAIAHGDLAEPLIARGALDEAEEHLVRAYEIYRNIYGEHHLKTINGLNNIGTVVQGKGDLERAARIFQEVLDALGTLVPPGHPDLIAPLANLGLVALDRGDFEQAKDLFARAAEIQLRVAPKHPNTAIILSNQSLVALGLEDFEGVLRSSSQALSIVESTLSDDHELAADALTNMGDALVHLGRPGEALPHLRRALAIRAGGEVSEPVSHAYTELTLARALWESNTERSRALELARSARDRMIDAGEAEDDVEEVRQWLKERGAR